MLEICEKCKTPDACLLVGCEQKETKTTAADVLESMAKTFASRNAIHDDAYKKITEMIKILFPNGISQELILSYEWRIFELILVKIARFASSGLTHQDSIHDNGVYSAIMESILISKIKQD
jgi:hypothetical protein